MYHILFNTTNNIYIQYLYRIKTKAVKNAIYSNFLFKKTKEKNMNEKEQSTGNTSGNSN